MEQQIIKAIDMHSHINHGSSLDVEESDWYSAKADDILGINKSAFIERTICCPYAGALHKEFVEESNTVMYDLVQKEDRLFQWVIIEPENDNTFVQAQKMLKNSKCVGIKLLPSNHGYDFEEWGEKIFAFASMHKTPVLIHPKANADYILPFADRFPKVKFILAHMWGKPHVDAIEFAKNGNVYVDTSGSASMQNGIIEYAVRRVGSERILFGTDTYAAGSQRGRIDYARISYEDKFNILRDNAMRLFGWN